MCMTYMSHFLAMVKPGSFILKEELNDNETERTLLPAYI